jgi:hypothetical protein
MAADGAMNAAIASRRAPAALAFDSTHLLHIECLPRAKNLQTHRNGLYIGGGMIGNTFSIESTNMHYW